MSDPRSPHVDFGESRFSALYRRAAERARFEHAELVPGAHSPSEPELVRYVAGVLQERGIPARQGPELLVAMYLRGLNVSPERFVKEWQRQISWMIGQQQHRESIATLLARLIERRAAAEQ